MSKKLLIVPSALFVPPELQSELGQIPHVLLPYDNKTILDHLCSTLYGEHEFDIFVGVSQGAQLVHQYAKRKRLPINVVDVTPLSDLGYTVRTVLGHALEQACYDDLFINFGDTVLYNAVTVLQDSDSVVVQKARDNSKWTTVTSLDERLVFVDKGSEKPISQDNIVAGCFRISNPLRLLQLLKENDEHLIPNLDSFYVALSAYSTEVQMTLTTVGEKQCLDFGHSEQYGHSRRMVKERSFNTIKLDPLRAKLTKTSQNAQKLIQEIDWYLTLPKELTYLVPRIFTFDKVVASPSITMEYYPYSTLSELFVFGNLSLAKWERIVDRLFWVLEEFSQFNITSSASEIKSVQKSMYLDKTLQRVQTLRDTWEYVDIFEAGVVINGHPHKPLQVYLDLLKTFILNHQPSSSTLNVVHGDYCLSNILYSPKDDLIKLIDPRGSFGRTGIYGDQAYDLAKLSHSFLGRYDFLINDLFSLGMNANNVTMHIFSNTKHDEIALMYKDKLSKRLGGKASFIDLLEATLFVSMVPLHTESPMRQLAMMTIGVGKLDEVLNRLVPASLEVAVGGETNVCNNCDSHL